MVMPLLVTCAIAVKFKHARHAIFFSQKLHEPALKTIRAYQPGHAVNWHRTKPMASIIAKLFAERRRQYLAVIYARYLGGGERIEMWELSQ
jgi:hypothetical protein